MEITCLRNSLRNGLNTLDKLIITDPGIAAKQILQYRSQVLIEANRSTGITLTGTDLETWATLQIAGQIVEPGEALFTGYTLANFVKVLKDNCEIELKAGDGRASRMYVNAKDHKTWMTVGIPREYPPHPQPGQDAIWLKSRMHFSISYLAQQALAAAAKEDSRPMLAGVSIAVKDNVCTVLGGDGYRIGLGQEECEAPDLCTIVPARALHTALEMIGGGIDVAVEDNHLHFRTETALVTTQTMRGIYPDLTHLIGSSGDLQLTLDRDEFVNTVNPCRIFARHSIDCLDIEIIPAGDSSATLRIAGGTADVGNNVATLHEIACLNPRPIKFTINGKNLMDAVQAIGLSPLRIEISTSHDPIVVRSTHSTDHGVPAYKHILMPMVRVR